MSCQALALLGGVTRNTIYDLIRSGELAGVPIGRRRFIAAGAIAAFIATTSTTEAPGGSLAADSRAVQQRPRSIPLQNATPQGLTHRDFVPEN